MPRMSRVVVIGFPHHPTQRENYQECVSEDKHGLRQRLMKNEIASLALAMTWFSEYLHCPKSKNQ